MNPYRLKHVPTGLYYKNVQNTNSNLSKTGKIYGTKSNGLSSTIRYKYSTFAVYCATNSWIFKQTKDILDWKVDNYSRGRLVSSTLVSDWIIEELKIEDNDK